MDRVAMLSVHGCPLDRLGTREAGGLQMYVRALSRELGRRGFAVDVYTRRTDPGLSEIVEFGPNARVIHLTAGPAAPIDKNLVLDHLPEFLCRLNRFRLAAGLDYQVIHSHYWLSGWVGDLLRRRWNVPHVTMFHTLGLMKNRALADRGETDRRIAIEGRIARHADQIVASSAHERDALNSLYRAPLDAVSVVPCGVDLNLFQPIPANWARTQLGLEARPTLVFVGRMDPVKGLDLLLRALALIEPAQRPLLLVVGGSALEPEFERCQALTRSLKIIDSVRFIGAVAPEKLPLIYSAATACVVPSHYESFGLVAMEALACGTPVIASMVGGLPTVISDGENGLLVPWRVPEAFAASIRQLVRQPALRDRLGTAARQSVERFGWAGVAESVIGIYREVGVQRTPILAGVDRR